MDIISFHVPKTAGTTFESYLIMIYGNKHYSFKRWEGFNIPRDAKSMHGHFTTEEVYFPEAKKVIWLRDPLQRVMSHYYYDLHTMNLDGPVHDIIRSGRGGPKWYSDISRNIYRHYMGGCGLDDFDFVGITEDFRGSLERFYQNIRPDQLVIPDIYIHKRRGPKSAGQKGYEVSPDVEEYIRMKNEEDYEVYNEAVRRFAPCLL